MGDDDDGGASGDGCFWGAVFAGVVSAEAGFAKGVDERAGVPERLLDVLEARVGAAEYGFGAPAEGLDIACIGDKQPILVELGRHCVGTEHAARRPATPRTVDFGNWVVLLA